MMPFYPIVRNGDSVLTLYHFNIVSAFASGTVDACLGCQVPRLASAARSDDRNLSS